MTYRSLIAPALAAMLVIGSACDPPTEAAEATDEEPEARPVPVEARAVTTASIEETVQANTTLTAATEVEVVAEVPGVASQITVDEGDPVTEGLRLLRVSQPDVRFAIADAELALDQAREQVEQLRPLVDEGLISRQAFDEARYAQERAELAYDRARAQSRETHVSSPIAGTVIRRHIELGEAVVPNQALFEIATLDTLEAVVAVPERDLATLRVGQLAHVALTAIDVTVDGEVAWIDPIVDPQAGTVRVRVTLGTPPAGVTLRPGMFAAVEIVSQVLDDVLVVPKRAIIYEADHAYVFVVRDLVVHEGSGEAPERDAFHVERVQITLGAESGDVIQVVEGLSVADRVVVVGHDGLGADATVFLSGATP